MEVSKDEFLKSLHDRDGRQFELVEGEWDHELKGWSPTRYFEKLPEQAKLWSGETGYIKAARKARQQIHRKCSPEPKPFTYRLGYNHCVGGWPGQNDYPILSGSCLNRKKKEARPGERKKSESVVHLFSARSRGKVKDKATAFYRSAAGDRIFLTLTFIQAVTDKEGVQILNKFLTVLRKEKSGLQYLWVAEHQDSNPDTPNNIHFHIIINKRLAVKRYNALWVLQQYNAGLQGKSKSGEPISREEVEKRYQYDISSKFKKKDPDSMMAVLNPLDVEKAYGVNGLAYYLTKYISKQKNKDPFDCLNWHCSRRVSRLFTKEVVGPSTFAYLLSFNNYKVNPKTGECWKAEIISRQFFTMVYVNNKGAPLSRLKKLEQVNKWIMKEDFTVDKVPTYNDALYRKYHVNGTEE